MIIYRKYCTPGKIQNEEKAKAAERMLIEFDVQKKEKENEQLKIQNSLQEGRLLLLA